MGNKCVYVHKQDGIVVYVGSGDKLRANSKTNRSPEHILIWDKLQIEIVSNNLSTAESIKLEQDLIDNHWPSGKLLNRNKNVYSVKRIRFEELNEVLYYDETSPTFLRWKVSTAKKIKAGDSVGYINNNGYIHVRLKGKNYLAHRIVLVLSTKEDIPDGFVVDHIDGNRSNNSIGNLRIVNQSDNSINKIHKIPNTGHKGISEQVNQKCFKVSFTDCKRIFKYFSYTDKPNKRSNNHYPTRELAFEAALAYRDTLVQQGKIILT